MIVLFTDFGIEGPYLGQMKAVLCRDAPGVALIDLFADVPLYDPIGAAYLLAAYSAELPVGTVLLCVVDPGVGSARRAAVVQADGRWYVGPDNGLFNVVALRARSLAWWDITWRPEHLSASFHGRDLFAPVAARLARGEPPPGEARDPAMRLSQDWPEDLARLVYIDRFGNAMTGLRAVRLAPSVRLRVQGHTLDRARTFSDVPAGQGFWYENANGLAEIAVNQGSARDQYALRVGMAVEVV